MSYIFECSYLKLNAKLKKQIVALTWRRKYARGFEETSGMLRRLRMTLDKSRFNVVLCLEGDVVLGWALVDKERKDIMVYVRKGCRRMGVGTRIMKAVHKRYGMYQVHPWDDVSYGFFSHVGYKCRKEAR